MTIQKRTKQRIFITLGAILIFALLVVFVFSGDNWKIVESLFTKNLSEEELRDHLQAFGWRGYIALIILITLQVVCSFLPGEPIQVLAGLTFGFPVGLLCCMAGEFCGATLIYLLQKTFGDRLRDFFIQKMSLDLEKLARSGKITIIVFILFFLPAIPCGMICFFAASIGMPYWRYIIITMLGAFPSVCIGVGLGHMAITTDWIITVCIFAVLIMIMVWLFRKKDMLFSKLNDYADKSSGTIRHKVRKGNGFVINVVYYAVRFYFFLHGARIKTVNKVGDPESPSIILCNHGSAFDFIYMCTMLRKQKPNLVSARLYFYHKYLAKLLYTAGAFPKSMFATDLESVKNCLTVLKEGGHLAMMPEARLSTAGQFEDIQESTYSFIKKAGAHVYTVKINGSYLAKPKWGNGYRRGALVEIELDTLYTPEQVKSLSVAQMKEEIEQRLHYDEFQWLQTHPEVHYRSRRLTEGLENILTTCPICHQKHTLTTKGNKIYCDRCGELTAMDNRYAFSPDFRFANLAEWYRWQQTLWQEELAQTEDYVLSSHVELRLPGEGKSLTRHAGYGTCTLDRSGLTYSGTKDGETIEKHFPLARIYRLLFGAGENFETYNGSEIWYFVPEDRRSAVDWYIVSTILYNESIRPTA